MTACSSAGVGARINAGPGRQRQGLWDGALAVSARVLNAWYLSPTSQATGWYVTNSATTFVPAELVLHARFEMEDAQFPPRGASSLQRQAVKLGAVVLSEVEQDATMEELARRHGG